HLAMQGSPDVSLMVEHDGKIVWPTQRLQSPVLNAEQRSLAFTEIVDTVALFAWLHKDASIKRLDAEIDSEKDDPNALTVDERQKRAAVVQQDLRAIEREEAALMFKGWADGLPIDPRPDLDPAAVLAIELVTAPR